MQPSNPRALRPPQRWLRHTLKHHATEGRKVFPDLSWQCLTSPSELTRVYLFLLPHASSASSSASSLLASCLTSSKTSASRFLLLLLVAFWALLPLASSSSLLAPNFRSCFPSYCAQPIKAKVRRLFSSGTWEKHCEKHIFYCIFSACAFNKINSFKECELFFVEKL